MFLSKKNQRHNRFFVIGHTHKNVFDGILIIVVLRLCRFVICDPSARNQSHVGRVRFPLRAEMHGRGHITDSCFIAFITSKIC